MKCPFGISNFLEDISSLSHYIVFLYYFALITEKGFLISTCCSLELAFRWVYLSFSSLFYCLFFSQLFLRSSRQPFCLFAFFLLGDGFDHCLLYSVMNLHPQFFRHSIFQIYYLESICHFHCIIIRDLV